MAIATSRKQAGFSIIELLVVVIIIGILATLATVNLLDSRARARDANRKSSVDSYSTAMEQWRVMSGHTYFVFEQSNSADPKCDKASRSVGDGYMIGDVTNPSCVGYQGGGAGRMTRKKVSSTDPLTYGKTSIAEALRNSGVLTTIRPDPSDNGRFTEIESGKDFILTLCDGTGAAAKTPQSAVEYSIYASLEKGDPSPSADSPEKQARHSCGGPDTVHSWYIEYSWK